MSRSGNFRAKNGPQGLLSCKYKRNVPIYQQLTGTTAIIPMNCRVCWNCRENERNGYLGRIGAEALSCVRLDFLTCSYDPEQRRQTDPKLKIEGRASGKVRQPEHIKQLRDRLNARDLRKIKKYNRKIIREANIHGPVQGLIDQTKRYIKTFVAHEWGTKGTKRSHWHIIVMYRSHFPVPDHILQTGDLNQTQEYCRRVWMPDCVTGPPPKKLPPQANDPSVIDFRTTKMQLWELWPWGFVNVQSITHDTTVPNGAPMPLKSGQDMVAAIDYVSKYLGKQALIPKGKSLHEMENWTPKERNAFYQDMKSPVQRTQSREIGHEYAKAWGRHRANMGVQPHDMTFVLEQQNVKRNHASVEKFRTKIRAKQEGRPMLGTKDWSTSTLAESMIERRKRFKMTGSMKNAAILAYRDRREEKIGRKLTISELSDPLISALMQAESDEWKKYLKSNDAVVKRSIAKAEGHELPEALPFVDVYETRNGVLMDGGEFARDKRCKEVRKPIDRYNERAAEIARQEALYVLQVRSDKQFEKLKRVIGNTDFERLSTDHLLAARPKQKVERYKREHDVKRIEKVLQELDADGTIEAKEEAEWIRDWMYKTEREFLGLKKHTLVSDAVLERVLIEWLNTSNDYDFPTMREKAARYCCKFHIDEPDFQLVENGHGDFFVRRLAEVEQSAWKEGGVKPKRVRYIRKWVTTQINPAEHNPYAMADKAKRPPNNTPLDQDPIFRAEQPLKRHIKLNARGQEPEGTAKKSEAQTHKKPKRREGENMGVKTMSVSTAKRKRPTLAEHDREYRLSKSRERGPVEGADYALWHAYRHCRPKGCNALLRAALDAKCINDVYGFYK